MRPLSKQAAVLRLAGKPKPAPTAPSSLAGRPTTLSIGGKTYPIAAWSKDGEPLFEGPTGLISVSDYNRDVAKFNQQAAAPASMSISGGAFGQWARDSMDSVTRAADPYVQSAITKIKTLAGTGTGRK